MKAINLRIAEELGVREQQVAAAISLLDGGATVPFVARYRKEATGALDYAQLRTLEERLRYLRAVAEREFPAITASLSAEVVPELREYECATTTLANAFVQPLMDPPARVMGPENLQCAGVD
jgi:uncharacterized protein